jgi:uncharacterized protein (TIGR02118 family)
MIKLIIFFRKPVDTAAFEEHFAQQYVPAANTMPNVKRVSVSRAMGAPRGEPPYYLIQELYFEDMAALNQSLNSIEGRNAGAVLMSFAHEIVSLMFAEVWE